MKSVSIKFFSSLIAAFILFASPVSVQAKTSSTPSSNPANNSFNPGGRDKHSDDLWNVYQQRRLGAQTPNNGKTSSAVSNPKFGNNRPAIKKIVFHKSELKKGAQAQPIKSSSSSSSMGGY